MRRDRAEARGGEVRRVERAARRCDGRSPAPPPARRPACAEVLRTFRRNQDQRGGAIVLLAAIEQAIGFRDPARRVIHLFGERTAVHHRARIGLGVMIRRHCDGPHRLAPDAVFMRVAHELQRVALRRYEDAVGVDQCIVAGTVHRPRHVRSAGTGPVRARDTPPQCLPGRR